MGDEETRLAATLPTIVRAS